MPVNEDEPFLSRWSRRKRAGDAAPVAAPAAKSAEPVAPAAPEPEIDPATLPKIEEMTASSDFSVFLKKGVPELLKRQALRHAWTIDPEIRDFVEVAENQYNWNIPGSVPGFGELPAGTDLKALLAQAIGERPKAEAPPEPCVAAAAQHEDPGRTTPVEQSAAEEPATGVAPNAPAEEKSATAEAPSEVAIDQSKPQPRLVRSARRRHGGALPDADGYA